LGGKQEKDGFQGKLDKASLPSLPTWKEREAATNMDKGLAGPRPWLLAKDEAPRLYHGAKKRFRSLFEKFLHFCSM